MGTLKKSKIHAVLNPHIVCFLIALTPVVCLFQEVNAQAKKNGGRSSRQARLEEQKEASAEQAGKKMVQDAVMMIALTPQWRNEFLSKQASENDKMTKFAEGIMKAGDEMNTAESLQRLKLTPALQNAPDWLKRLVSDWDHLQETLGVDGNSVPGLSARLTSYQYHNQIAYHLNSKLISVLYDGKGEILCTLLLPEGPSDAAAKCPDFKSNRSEAKLVWQSAKKMKR
jgi:cellobiose-specific phosphotransferase system component IIA